MSNQLLAERIAALEALLNATRDQLGTHVEENASVQDTAWVVTTATLIVFMQLGFAMLEAGSVRSHNAIATYAKNILDFVHGSVVAVILSYWIAYGIHPFDEGRNDNGVMQRNFFHYLTFQATTATIVSGAMAERVRLSAYLAICTLISGFIFPFAVWCTWSDGWLVQLDPPFHDFAGSGVVHMVGGLSGLLGCVAIGARNGRWNVDTAGDFRPHNVMSVLSGVLILWVGWYGFNCGSTGSMSVHSDASTASRVAMNTTVAAAFGATFAILISTIRSRSGKIDILALGNGVLAGLVAITAACDVVSAASATIIGIVAAVILVSTQDLLEYYQIDDVVAAFPVHGACGLWGVLAAGLFHMESGLLTTGSATLLRSQAIGVATLSGICSTVVLVLYPLRWAGCLRISAEEETVGMDSMFGLNAYENHSDFVARYHIVSELLTQAGASPKHLINALGSLHENIFRPLTPFAGDHRLHGEVADILDHVYYGHENSGDEGGQERPEKKHLLFLSHYKTTGGEAVRIFMDKARVLLAESKDPAVRSAVSKFEPKDLIYLDSVNLKDLSRLLNEVGASLNVVLFLTRNCLSRPWVLAELCKAYTSNINLILVKVENTADHQFAFPKDVDKALTDWKWLVRQQADKGFSGLSRRYSALKSSLRFSRSKLAVAAPDERPNSQPGGSNDAITAAGQGRKMKSAARMQRVLMNWFKEGEWEGGSFDAGKREANSSSHGRKAWKTKGQRAEPGRQVV